MERYTLGILPSAKKKQETLPHNVYSQIRDAITDLRQNPRPYGSIKLSGRSDYRIRVGDFRILYAIDDTQQTITILDVDMRRDVYRQR